MAELPTAEVDLREHLDERLEDFIHHPPYGLHNYIDKFIEILTTILIHTAQRSVPESWSTAYKEEVFQYGAEVFELVGYKLEDISGEDRPTNLTEIQYSSRWFSQQDPTRTARRQQYAAFLDKFLEPHTQADPTHAHLKYAGFVLTETFRDLLFLTEVDNDEQSLDVVDLAWRKELFAFAVCALRGLAQLLSACFETRAVRVWDNYVDGLVLFHQRNRHSETGE